MNHLITFNLDKPIKVPPWATSTLQGKTNAQLLNMNKKFDTITFIHPIGKDHVIFLANSYVERSCRVPSRLPPMKHGLLLILDESSIQ